MKPPAKFREVRAATLLMLYGEAVDNLQWAKALLYGSREERKRVLHENEDHETDA
jgi:hypothetical protein